MGKTGKWGSFSSVKVEGLDEAIASILADYGDVVYQATEEGLAAAEKVLVKNLKSASPGPPKSTGDFAKAWKGTGKKYKMVRFVGNAKTVEGRRAGKIALANILEYSTTRGKPFIKETHERSIKEMAAAVVAEIKKEV